jgi:arsenate reductase-like glutaredoxin family protein
MDAHGIERREIVSASKKLGRAEAAELAKQVAKVIVAKGKSVQEFGGGKIGKDIVEAMLGPTGNLRAPVLRVGKTLVVGFHEDLYRAQLL